MCILMVTERLDIRSYLSVLMCILMATERLDIMSYLSVLMCILMATERLDIRSYLTVFSWENAVLCGLYLACQAVWSGCMLYCVAYTWHARKTGQGVCCVLWHILGNLACQVVLNIFINIWFAIWRLNKYILYGKDFLKASRPSKV